MQDAEVLTLISKWNPHFTNLEKGSWHHTTPRQWYLSQLEKVMNMRHVIVLTGVRRSGKSVLLQQLMWQLIKSGVPAQNVVYINLEDFVIEKYLVEECKLRDAFVVGAELLDQIYRIYKTAFNPQGKVYLFLDEIQGIPAYNHVINTWYETRENLKVFMTGSSRSIEASKTATLLTGRSIQFEIRPLNFVEYLAIHGVNIVGHRQVAEVWKHNLEQLTAIQHHLDRYLREGGYPEIVLASDASEKQLLAQSYYRTFLMRDIIVPHNIRNAKDIETLGLRILADFTKTHTYRKLGEPLKLSAETVKNYLSYFYDSFILAESTFFSYSTKKSQDVQKPKKIYVVDNGLRNYNVLKFSPDLGRNVENTVFNELTRHQAGVFYWQKEREVDFVTQGEHLGLYNCSYGDAVPERETEGLLEAMEEFSLTTATLITKSTYQTEQHENKTIHLVPLWAWLIAQASK